MSSSPPRGLSRSPNPSPSSAKRRPLHQRTDSETNSTPTIRIIADSSPSVYSKSPFPSHPSQILQPRYAPFGQGIRVSDENTPANNTTTNTTKREALVPRPLQPRKSNRSSTSTVNSDPDTSQDTSLDHGAPSTPPSSRFSATTSPPSSPIDEDFHRVDTKLSPVREELVPGPSSRSTIRAVPPSPANDFELVGRKQSETSLASSASSDIPPAQEYDTRRKSSTSSQNFVVFPHSSVTSLPADKRAAQDPTLSLQSIHHYSSVESLAFSDASYTTNGERPRSASTPANPSYAGLRAAYKSGARVQFPAIRAASGSRSWARVSHPEDKVTPRMNDGSYRSPPWSSRLSTIASESTERESQSLSSGGQYYPRRRRTIGSIASDGQRVSSPGEEQDSIFEEGSGVLTGTNSNVSLPYPPALFTSPSTRPLPPIPGDDDHEIQGRDSDERNDTLGELQALQHLRPQRSGFLSRLSNRSRPGSSDSAHSHASQISFIGDLSWAKYVFSFFLFDVHDEMSRHLKKQ
jgi:hypothetical protein